MYQQSRHSEQVNCSSHRSHGQRIPHTHIPSEQRSTSFTSSCHPLIHNYQRHLTQASKSSIRHIPLLLIVCVLISETHLSFCQTTSNGQPFLPRYSSRQPHPTANNGRSQLSDDQSSDGGAFIPQNWDRGIVPEHRDTEAQQANQDQSLALIVRRNSNKQTTNQMKSVRHIVPGSSLSSQRSDSSLSNEDICSDRLCYGLPMGCLGGEESSGGTMSTNGNSLISPINPIQTGRMAGSKCSVLVTSKRFIDPNRPVSRDILFELIALPVPDISNYAAVGFSETGRMQGLVSECLQYRDSKTQLQIIKLSHSYNIPNAYTNVPVTILSGIKNLGVSFENGFYQCRWIVESAVEFSYEATNGSIINRREDLGYKNYHILLAAGQYNEVTDGKICLR